jgi:hypothetical protein
MSTEDFKFAIKHEDMSEEMKAEVIKVTKEAFKNLDQNQNNVGTFALVSLVCFSVRAF